MVFLCLHPAWAWRFFGKDAVPQAALYARNDKNLTFHYSPQIEGGFITLTPHQLALWWWLYRQGHLSKQGLRTCFAAVEMKTRRDVHPRNPSLGRAGRRQTQDAPRASREARYRIEEVARLVGCPLTPNALSGLSGEVKRLGRLGVVKLGGQSIELAQSIDQIVGLEADAVGRFLGFLAGLPNTARQVPVPRRLLRALAGGFSDGKMAVLIALLIRSVFWHRDEKAFRIDGRTKADWIAEVFGLSSRTVSRARAELRSLGVIVAVDNRQWALNRWGAQDIINVAWVAGEPGPIEPSVQAPHGDAPETHADPDCHPSRDSNDPGLSPPYKPASSSQREESKNQTPADADRKAGCFSIRKKGGQEPPAPRLRGGVTRAHLHDDRALLDLYDQARGSGLIHRGRDGLRDFLGFAHHALNHAEGDPGRLFYWLLRERKIAYLTEADLEAGKARLLRIEERQTPAWLRPQPLCSEPVLVGRGPVSQDAQVVDLLQRRFQWDEGQLRRARAGLIVQHGWTQDRWDTAEAELHGRVG